MKHSLIANVTFALFKIFGGLISGSAALLVDGVRNIVDSLYFIFRNSMFSLGHVFARWNIKSEHVASLFAVSIYVVMAFLVIRLGFSRLFDPVSVHSLLMLSFAIVAIAANFASARFISSRRQQSRDHIFLYQQSVSAVLSTFFVIVIGVVIGVTRWNLADTVLALATGVFMLLQAAIIFKDWIVDLLEKPILKVDTVELASVLCEDDAVIAASDLKSWLGSNGNTCISAKLIIPKYQLAHMLDIRQRLHQKLWTKYQITWVTFTFEAQKEEKAGLLDGISFTDVQMN